MKKTISVLLAVMMFLSTFVGMTFTANADTQNGWVKHTETYGDTTYTYWYYYENGSPVSGWKKIKNVWYYFVEDWGGQMVANSTYGVDGKLYFFKSSGAMATGWAKSTWGSWYYASKSGALVTGWKQISNKWYYFDKDDGEMYVGVYKIGSKYYLFDANGAWVKSPKKGWNSTKITSSDGTSTEWCYYNGKTFVTGWLKVSGKWYYFNPSYGNMLTGSFSDGKKLYYANSNGSLREKAGWVKETYTWEGETYYDWYYTNKDGTLKTGLQTIGGKLYYFDEDYGYLWTNESGVEIDGYYYDIDSNGVCTACP